jgi:rubrerythrin
MDAVTVLKQAMKLERDGLEFYLSAAECSKDTATGQLFRDLAADEVDHYNYLGRQYDALVAGETWVAVPDLMSVEPADLHSPIFPEGLRACSVLPDDPSDEDALLFALGAEMKSYELYSQTAKQVSDVEARRLFLSLASAEQQHFDLIMTRYNSLFGYPR